MKSISIILLTLLVAVPATWFGVRYFESQRKVQPAPPRTERKVLYYQSAMHPWIKSDKPGRCTICGMELTPVYEGDPGFDQAGGDLVTLTPSIIQVLNVQTAEAQVQPLQKTLTVAGTIEENASRHRVLSAYIPGRIDKLFVNYVGAEVKEGQPLAEFYSPGLLQAEREYRTVSGDLRASTALRLRQMGLTTAQIQALAEKPADALTSQILAPVTGTVVAQKVYAGQYVEEGAPLFEIADFSTMWFQFQAYEQDLPWFKVGLKVDAATPAHPARTFTGNITFIDPNFDGGTRSAKVRVEFENPLVEGGDSSIPPHRLLLNGVYAEARVHLDVPNVLTVPRTAVIQTSPEAIVFVDKGGGAYRRHVVQLGQRGDTLVEIASGLSPGDKVVVNGNLLIDSQAEMNRTLSSMGGGSYTSTGAASTSLPPLTAPQRESIQAIISLADSMSESLAADKLENFNALAQKAHRGTAHWLTPFPNDSPWRPLLKPFESTGHIEKASDLKDARRMFHPFSTAAVALAHTLRANDTNFATLKIYRCPMTKSVFEGAPKQSDWVQLKEPLRNPYFGAEMLDCGTEVKP
jgi:Cu(I)/Ag(I) efflux system membrane fusion protein